MLDEEEGACFNGAITKPQVIASASCVQYYVEIFYYSCTALLVFNTDFVFLFMNDTESL